MRSFLANQQPVFFKLYEGEQEITDPDGNPIGSFLPQYSPIKAAMLCVSPNKGASEMNQFGTFADYDRTMTTADTTCPIDENAVLWVDGADTEGPYNAIVKKKALWKNSVQYAIQHVTVSEYQAQQEKIAHAIRMKEQMEAQYAENQHET